MKNNQVQNQSLAQNAEWDNKQDSEYKEYNSRWSTVGGFLIINIVYNTVLAAFNPINSQVSKIYDINPVVVSMNTLAANLLYLPMAFVASFMMQKIGMRTTIWISSAILVAALWIRLLINNNYYSVLAAHILLGIGLPLNQNMINSIPSVWFRVDVRQKIFLLCLLGSFLGLILSNLLPGLWLNGYDIDKDSLNNYREGRNKLYDIMSVEAYVGTPLALIGCILFQNKPPTPPSKEAAKEKQPFLPQVKAVFSNKDYILLFLSFGLFQGCNGGAGVVLSYILTPFGYGSEVTTYCNNIVVIAGVIGMMRGGKMFKKNPNYKKHLMVSCVMCMIGFGVAIPVLPANNQTLLILPYALIGILSFHPMPLFISLSSEVAYPVDPTISGGLLQGSAQLMSFISGEVYSAIMIKETEERAKVVYIIQIICIGIAFLLLFPLTVQLKRTEAEQIVKQPEQKQVQQQSKQKGKYNANF
ncbi:hypothetical protein ABPG74_001221 [Tetrahymena malaccensis]